MAKTAIRWLPLILALVLLGGMVAYAQSTNVINACYEKKTGLMHYQSAWPPGAKCPNGQYPLQWNMQGPPGPVNAFAGLVREDGSIYGSGFTAQRLGEGQYRVSFPAVTCPGQNIIPTIQMWNAGAPALKDFIDVACNSGTPYFEIHFVTDANFFFHVIAVTPASTQAGAQPLADGAGN